MTLAIETEGLSYRASREFSIDDVGMRVPAGCIYGFLGPNGAGKTTTIRLLLGLLKPRAGRVTILGRDMPADYVGILARLGYVPERPHLYPSLTVAEAMEFHAAFHATWDAARAAELRARFALDPSRRIATLSKGETGKLMFLLAIVTQPELLVLDEPTDGLDPVVRRDMLAALADYVASRQATVLISSHLVHELERMCDWIALMDGGRLVAESPMQQFKDGTKRLRIAGGTVDPARAPFSVLERVQLNGSGEQWLVRGWRPEMREYVESSGGTLREVIDLDLEEAFVEVLRAARTFPSSHARP